MPKVSIIYQAICSSVDDGNTTPPYLNTIIAEKVGIAMLKELLKKLEALEVEGKDYLEYMRLQFEIKEKIAEEEIKQFLEDIKEDTK